MLLPILTTNVPVSDLFTVVSVERHESFAGRLGMRVNETLTLSKDGQTFVVELGHTHTRNSGLAPFKVGEMLRIDGSVASGHLLRDAIVR